MQKNKMTNNPTDPFKGSIADSQKRLRALSASGQKIIGYFCTYTPVEILHAAGFIPVRITAGIGRMDKAAAHLPEFICPFMKLSLEKALGGQYDFLSGLVQGYSCDAACGLVNIWKDIFKDRLFHSLPIPYNNNPESRAYYRSAILELIGGLKTLGGHFSETALKNSMDLYSRIRSLQLELTDHRHKGNPAVSSSRLMTVVDAGFLTPPDHYLSMLRDFMDQLLQDPPEIKDGFPVLVSGSLIEDPGVLDIIESSGGRVVADDLCNGFRQMFPPDGIGETPMDRVIDRYMNRFPCPARSRAVDRSRRLLDLARDFGARGVIFVVQKFCTPHLADYPAVSEALKKNGIPSILIEMDETWQMEAQLKTRLESFFEMTGNRA
jgi:benzoyl-CoA reductase/2-hydroxyglutaryl-CoA dehydratase subunit BcrC/BadD/HgdB